LPATGTSDRLLTDSYIGASTFEWIHSLSPAVLLKKNSLLRAETARLENVLASIEPNGLVASAAPADRPVKVGNASPAAEASGTSTHGRSAGSPALEIIQTSGRKGIKALALSSQLKKAGEDRPSKDELIATGKVKVSGKGGGTTYTYSA
jgi:hypothetical protein